MFINNSMISPYSEGTVYTDQVPVKEIYTEDFVAMALESATENTENLHRIFMPLAIAEVKAAGRGVSPLEVYTEGTVGDFFKKVKEFLTKIWQKIKSIFAKIMVRIDANFRSGKNFFDKYKKTLSRKCSDVDFSKLSLKGYKFEIEKFNAKLSELTAFDLSDNGNRSSLFTKAGITSGSLTSEITDSVVEDAGDKLRAAAFKDFTNKDASGDLTPKELQDELTDYYYGDKQKEELNDESAYTSYSYLVTWLDNKKVTTELQKDQDKIKNAFEKAIRNSEKWNTNTNAKGVDTARKDLENNKDDEGKKTALTNAEKSVTNGGHLLSFLNAYSSAITTCTTVRAKAANDAISQAKSFASIILRAPSRSGQTYNNLGESAGYGNSYYGGGDIFGNVRLR